MKNKEKKKDIIILILCIIVTILIVGFILFSTNKLTKATSIDGSEMSSYELIEMFKQEGYEIKITNLDNYIYISLKNDKKGITIQKIPNTLVGTLMTFDDDSINNEMADLIDMSENDTPQKKQQYKAFESWLEHYNISKSQISQMLDYYYTNNKSETKFINTKELLTDTEELLNSDK